ncbi:MAG: carboxymuconolactone decarboxylase family protein [Tumebacillaceae bacterium]
MSDDNLYKLSNMLRQAEASKIVPDAVKAFFEFDEKVYADGHLSLKVKEAIAVAVAHVTQCPYCIEVHVQRFKAAGGTKEEMMEAILVAGSVRAGGTLSHGVNALNAWDREKKPAEKATEPECFC